MNDPGGRRSYFGMTGSQITVLAVLALLTFGVVIGGGYYLLTDSGLIGGADNDSIAQSQTTPTVTSEGESPPTPTSTPEAGGKLPPAWTATPFGLAEIDYVQWAIQLSDLPTGFEKAPFDDFETGSGLVGEDGQGEMVNAFAFTKEGEDIQLVFGFAGLVLEHEQQEFDTQISQSEILVNEFVNTYEHNGILEEEQIGNLDDLGDIAFGYSYLLDMEGVEMRFDVIIFRRDIAGLMIFMNYIDGYPVTVSIRDLAFVLDQRIIPTLPNNP